MDILKKAKVFLTGTGRSSEAGRQVILSGFAKIVVALCLLLIVPLTIDYVNPTRFGIWLTVSSIIAWISSFDFGLGNGFRNRFAEAKAKGDTQLAREYVSTAYFSIICIAATVFLAIAVANSFLDWSTLLNIDPSYKDELRTVFFIMSAFFCMNLVASLFSILLVADQKNGLSAWINALGQMLSLAMIWFLTRHSEGSLIKLALYFSGIPCLVVLVVSIFAYSFSRYRIYKPSIKNIRLHLIKDILSLGIRFFVISVCVLVVFQMMNIVIARELGPEAVSEYNIAFKYFNVLYIIMLIIITPFWSAFTDAYTQRDISWMKMICRKLELIFGISIIMGIIMLVIAPTVYDVWIGDSVKVAFATSLAILIYTCAQMIGNVYMFMINGIGTIRIQLCIYLLMAVIAWPLMVWSCRQFGVAGIVIAPSAAYLIQAVFGRIQLTKIFNGTATGWWLK